MIGAGRGDEVEALGGRVQQVGLECVDHFQHQIDTGFPSRFGGVGDRRHTVLAARSLGMVAYFPWAEYRMPPSFVPPTSLTAATALASSSSPALTTVESSFDTSALKGSPMVTAISRSRTLARFARRSRSNFSGLR